MLPKESNITLPPFLTSCLIIGPNPPHPRHTVRKVLNPSSSNSRSPLNRTYGQKGSKTLPDPLSPPPRKEGLLPREAQMIVTPKGAF
ncbi:hypothetical protein L873DRAFT_593633 [Choiromyces venosus 120613-1]|uniref:Uncharacterized protein n=1 Tax=Choiromyces venosus 120613-1 TaxID=1336337 RepID=A0A3N4J786_9PEZI|nr:hypothetical protein L873DRAFT_593633 [Choiromyces venosus 120613-1]